MSSKGNHVSWSVEDHLVIFKEMKKHFKNQPIPLRNDIDTFQNFIDALPVEKRKFLHANVIALLKKGYASWLSGATEEEWFYKSKQHKKDSKPRPVLAPVTVKKKVQIEDLFSTPEKVVETKQELPKVIKEPLTVLAVTPTDVSGKLDKLTSMVKDIEDRLINDQGSLIDLIIHGFEEVKKTSSKELFDKPAKAVVETNKAFIKSEPVRTFGETEVRVSTASLKSSDDIVGSNILKEFIESNAPAKKVAFADVLAGPLVQVQKPLSEEDVRRIVRDEIEKIFGPTTTPKKEEKETPPVIAQVVPEVFKPAPFVKPEQVLKAILAEETVVKEPKQKFKVLVFGLTKPQVNRIIEKVSNNILIEGHEVYNNSTRDKAKRSDLVVVSRFSSHATYETLRSVCGLEKVVFVSGGVSMIQKKIVSLIDTATATK